MRKNLLLCLLSIFLFLDCFSQIPNGEVLWLKADKKVTVDSNNKVKIWKDNSPYLNNVYQYDTLNQPTLVQNVFGKRPAIFFNGVHGKYFLSNQFASLTSDGGARTVFVVGLLDSSAIDNGGGTDPSAGGTLFTFRRASPVFAVQIARIRDVYYAYTAGHAVDYYHNAIAPKSYYTKSKKCKFIDVFISSGAGTYIRARQNGVDVALSQVSPIANDNGASGFTVGDREDIVGQDWQGYIAEIIVYNRELDSNEIAQTEDYLTTKYHQCFSLPSNISNSFAEKPLTQNVSFSLYPNPANNSLYVNGLPQVGKVYLTVTDLTGRVVAVQEVSNNTIYVLNISKIKSGNYILYIQYNGNITSKQFVKQ